MHGLTPTELTERQKQVVRLIARGYTNEEIAAKLGISHSTARMHTNGARMKLGVELRRQLPAAYFKATGDNPWPVTIEDELLVGAA